MALLRKQSPDLDNIDAVVVFRDVEAIGQLKTALDDAIGASAWIAAGFEDAGEAVKDAAASEARYLLIGVQSEDADELAFAARLIKHAREFQLRSILLAETISPAAMHELMRAGADDFAPLPLPAAALQDCIRRLSVEAAQIASGGRSRLGLVYPVYGAGGGVGASTFAVNLAWETALAVGKKDLRVAIMDFNFQYGSVATYLDLPRREAIYELLSDTSTMDEEGFSQALTTYANKMDVLTAPMDALPLDIIGPDDVASLLALARANYDFIFVDLPQTLAHWSDMMLIESEVFFALMESDMRSAQNMLRFIRAVKAEELPFEKISVCLNRGPSFSDLAGKSRAGKLEKSLEIKFAHRIPDGGKAVAAACDQGTPLAKAAKGNAARKEMRKVAQKLVETAQKAAKQGLG
ncbi:MAG: AAA family ATPase [Pikeienuella sp.]